MGNWFPITQTCTWLFEFFNFLRWLLLIFFPIRILLKWIVKFTIIFLDLSTIISCFDFRIKHQFPQNLYAHFCQLKPSLFRNSLLYAYYSSNKLHSGQLTKITYQTILCFYFSCVFLIVRCLYRLFTVFI